MLLPKMFCENEKEALSERVPPDSMAGKWAKVQSS